MNKKRKKKGGSTNRVPMMFDDIYSIYIILSKSVHIDGGVRVMVFNATFNNISVIS